MFLPTDELGAGFSALAIVFGHVPQRQEVFGRRRDVLRSPLSAVGKDGAGMKLAAIAVAGRLAALTPQGVERARQERFAPEAVLKEGGQELLGLEEFGAEGAESLVHEVHRGKGVL